MFKSAQHVRIPLGVLCAIAFFIIGLLCLPEISTALTAQVKQAQAKRTPVRRKAKTKSVKPSVQPDSARALPVATPLDPMAATRDDGWRIGGDDASEAGARGKG